MDLLKELDQPQTCWDVFEEHRGEAEFSLELLETAQLSPTRSLDQIAKYPEERLLAHL